MTRRCVVLTWALSGCAMAYLPGGVALPPSGGRPQPLRTSGCLDLSVRPEREPQAAGGTVVIAVAFGNRCLAPVRMNLGRIHVRAVSWDAVEVSLSVYDPHAELLSTTLDSLGTADERIAFRPATIQRQSAWRSFCVFLGEVNEDVPALGMPAVCFRSPAEGAVDWIPTSEPAS